MTDIVERLIKVADASRRDDGSDIPLGQELREAAAEIGRLREVEKERDEWRERVVWLFTEERPPIVTQGSAGEHELADAVTDVQVRWWINTINSLRSQLTAAHQREREAVEAFGRLLRHVNIPDKVPDDLWTSCETDDYQMSDAEFGACRSAIRERGIDPDIALKSRSQRLMLWMDGVTIKDFRAAIAALEAIRARSTSATVKQASAAGVATIIEKDARG